MEAQMGLATLQEYGKRQQLWRFRPNIKCGTNPIKGGLVQASYYVFRISFLYLVKLVVMSFNLGIFIVVVAGHTLGFFLAKSHALALANREQESFSDAQKYGVDKRGRLR
ncbi:hypothetical protein JHK87_006505 [Glycine soja]|nr:hypothetical protein JHK87_006505 [Glycine soja]